MTPAGDIPGKKEINKRSKLAFEGRVEEETAKPDQKVPIKRDLEDRVMAVPPTTANTLDAKKHEQQIRERVHDLGGVDGRIVVLRRRDMITSAYFSDSFSFLLFFLCFYRTRDSIRENILLHTSSRSK